METIRWGASPEDWTHFSETLGWTEYLLPVVSNPGRKISERSTMQTLGKTPSQVMFTGEAAGVSKWTKYRASRGNVEAWARQPDHGICVQTGHGIIAIDVDVPSERKSRLIVDMVRDLTGVAVWPERYREGTGKTLLLFAWPWGDLYKRVLPVDGGMVEVLGLGQQFITSGTYIRADVGLPQGRYLWRVGDGKTHEQRLPGLADIPVLPDEKALADLVEGLEVMAGVGPWKVARSRRGPLEDVELPEPGADAVANWLVDNWPVMDVDHEGGWLHIACPFEHEHTTDSGPTSTTYFPAGTGGYQQGYFHCLHAHCQDRTQAEFREQCGFERDQFPDLPEAPEDQERREKPKALVAPKNVRDATQQGGGALKTYWPKLMMDSGVAEPTMSNLLAALSDPHLIGVHVAYDDFTAGVVWAPRETAIPQWRPLTDATYVDLRVLLEQKGFLPFGVQMLREAVWRVAEKNRVDTAIDWLSGLHWDGVERVETFLPETLPGVKDDEYTRALGRYIWTALAGRVLQPGVKADMLPILVGAEGLRKSSWVSALSPVPEFFSDAVSLMHRDDDNSRKMRGRLVVELPELKGLASRSGEEVRAFISRQFEEWTPKYKEMVTVFPRRCLMFGTTNDEQFLEPRMGMRRMLPLLVPDLGRKAGIEKLRAMAEQLWAEGAVRFLEAGVDWSVEDSAKQARVAFMAYDPWMSAVARWLLTRDPVTDRVPAGDRRRFSTEDVLLAVGEPLGRQGRSAQIRAGEVLAALGCTQKKMQGGPRRYVVPPSALQTISTWAGMDERDGGEGSAF